MLTCAFYFGVIFVQTFFLYEISATIIGAYVLPHGTYALNPQHMFTSDETVQRKSWELHNACKKIGREISDKKPDLVFLSTPHGVTDVNNFLFYLKSRAAGFAGGFCPCPKCCFNVSVEIDRRLSVNIIETLREKTTNVSGVHVFANAEPDPLRWAEVIPLYFISHLTGMKTLILSQPSRIYTHGLEMIPELLQLGHELYTILEGLDERVVIIISGDLAHTHQADGPYGFSSAAAQFDKACGDWVETLDHKVLLDTAAQHVESARVDAFTGLVMLHGVIEQADRNTWTSELLANQHPTYYGMMVASFNRVP